MNKEELLKYITDYYLQSDDFNGLLNCDIPEFNITDLIELIEEDRVRILTENDDINIYINRCNLFPEKFKQKENVCKENVFTIYPTEKQLAQTESREKKPFTEILAKGAEQFRIMYFAVDVLEIYINDPRYKIWDCGYRGNIYIQDYDEEQTDVIHSEYIRDFGIAYLREEPHNGDRAIGVFLRDLSKLNYEAQCKWRGFLLQDQNKFCINGGFVKNLLFGEWETGYWIFDALLDELKLINDMCQSIGLPKLFRKEYSREDQALMGYHIILIPSLRNYYEFVIALEKIVVNNLNYGMFQKQTLNINPVERKKEDKSLKGSIEMLDEWFSVNYFSNSPKGFQAFQTYISGVFREVRQKRQIPAHDLYENKHDITFYKQQDDLIIKVYHAIRNLRMMFQRHPLARAVVIPEILQDEDNIVIY